MVIHSKKKKNHCVSVLNKVLVLLLVYRLDAEPVI